MHQAYNHLQFQTDTVKFIATTKAILEQKLIRQTTRNKINERTDEKHFPSKVKLWIVKSRACCYYSPAS